MMLNKENLTRQYIDKYSPDNFYDKFNLLEIDNMDLLIEFAKSGIGIGCVIKEFVKKELRDKQLVECSLGIPQMPPREICFAYSMKRMPNSHVMEFMEYMKKKIF